MFRKILIANRGEIAVRIIRTARRLGIATVAVYSDADAAAMHVIEADEALRIGPAPVAHSYLDVAALIAACRASGAEAVHPGYGLLSENAGFAEAVAEAGAVFIGPSPKAIRAMGLKDAAKALMEAAGVPVVPGYHGDDQDEDRLAAEADRIGYPVLIKARAGGGGKGMRRVDRPDEFRHALEGARREAEASFGDGACLIEKYLTRPRHIEIQVFGDSHGNVVHLFERDCSLQRRHQKVIEEAPAPGMMPEMRARMGEAAVTAARAISYSGAGTIEFIADVSDGLSPDRFYFMEMNTRLQVEHPVTEAITGLDLVEWQLRVAAGEPLPMTQADLAIDGWAMEARLYAEDPAKGFLPATGVLRHLSLPHALARVDTGVRQGDEITPYYDPLIAKIVVHGPTRRAALNKLSTALAATSIAGTVTNAAFLASLAGHAGFAAGDVDTGLIDRDLARLVPSRPAPAEVLAVAGLAALDLLRPRTGPDPWERLAGWRLWSQASQFIRLVRHGERHDLEVAAVVPGSFRVGGSGGGVAVRILGHEDGLARLDLGGRIIRPVVVRGAGSVSVFTGGEAWDFEIPDWLDDEAGDDAGGDRVLSPMPGLVKLVAVKPGDRVTRGQRLAVLEAMKMEHTLLSPRDGEVAAVEAAAGEQVGEGALIVELVREAGGAQ